MKTGNTLRTAKNSLLCFFTTLAAGFLVACGGDGSGGVSFIGGDNVPPPPPLVVAPSVSPSVTMLPQQVLATVNISVYLHDTAAEGVAYSGPTGNGVTGKGGVFLASEGEFEFSIGGTTLGRVSLNSEWANNAVTPADFMGVDEPQVITIARIMQALDEDNTLQNGISISQSTRNDPEGVSTLYSRVGTSREAIAGNSVGDNNQQYTIPSVANAMNHLADTRKCLFSGGYVGDYSGFNNEDPPVELAGGRVYYAVEPFANRVRRFGLNAVAQTLMIDAISDIGVTGSEISLSSGNTLSFTPGFVTGTWETLDGTGTHTLSLAAGTGDPGATRRIVGVQTSGPVGTLTVARLYVLDYFSGDDSFRGRSYSVDADVTNQSVSIDALSLTIANGGSWPTVAMDTATTLILIGNATITVGVVRANDNYGRFDGVNIGDNELSGTWCDIGGAVGSTVAPMPPTPSIDVTVTWSEVSLATSYKLYRSTMTVSVGSTVSVADTQVGGDISTTTYVDTPPAGPKYFYRVEACNSAGCSQPPAQDPAVAGGAAVPECSVGTLAVGESCTWRGVTLMVESGGLSLSAPGEDTVVFPPDGVIDLDLEIPEDSGNFLRGMPSGTAWEITEAG